MKTFLLAIMLCVAFISNAQTITSKNTLKGWFVTGAKPTQNQYWAWLESYWHKSELIPVSSIEGLGDYMTYGYISNDTLYGVTSDTVFVIGVIDNGNISVDSTEIKYGNLDYVTDTPRADAISGNKYLITHTPPHFLADGTTVNIFYTHGDNIALNVGGTYSYTVPDTGDIASVANPTTAFYKYDGTKWNLIHRVVDYGGDALGVPADIGTNDSWALRFKTHGIVRLRFDKAGKMFLTQFKGISSGNVLKIIDSTTGEVGWDSTKPLNLQPPLYWLDSGHTIIALDTTGLGGGGTGGSTTFAGLTDVNLTSIANNQLVKYNSGTGKWINFTPTYISSYTETDPLSVHISDSAAMLLPYLRKNDTTGHWIGIGWLATLAAKQNAITTGTTSQYFRGDLSLATFPTNVSTFTNDAGYLTNTTGDARYFRISSNLSEGTASSMRTNLGLGSFATLANPATTGGDLIYYNGTSYLRFATGTAKQSLHPDGSGGYVWKDTTAAGGSGWGLTGNSGTTYTSNFIGSTDNVGFHIRTNNVQRMFIDSLGQIGMGVNSGLLSTLTVVDSSQSVYPAVSFTKQGTWASAGVVVGGSFANAQQRSGTGSSFNVAGQFSAANAVTNVAIQTSAGISVFNQSNLNSLSGAGGIVQIYGGSTTATVLSILGTNSSASNDGALLYLSRGNSNAPAYIRFDNSLTGPSAIAMNAWVSVEANGYSFYVRKATSNNLSGFGSFSNVLYAEAYSGRLGINTSSTPLGPLEVKNTGLGIGSVAKTSGGSTLTGTSSLFLTEFKVGDLITVNGEFSKTVASISSNTSLTISGTWSSTASGQVYTNTTSQNTNSITALQNGRVGIFTASPAYTLDVNGDGNFAAAIRKTRPDIATGSTPSNSLGTGAGTSPTASITGNDISGYVTINTGTTPTAGGDVITITFATALTNTPTSIILTAANENAAVDLTKIYVDQSSASSSSFKIKNISATALQASTTYKFYYHITQ